jgi:hypothetical protein
MLEFGKVVLADDELLNGDIPESSANECEDGRDDRGCSCGTT